MLFAFAMLARLYFAGVDRTAFQLVERLGLPEATHFVMDSYVDLSYGLWWIPVTASVGSIVGTVLLAYGAYRARTLGVVRGLLLILFGWMWMGVLKEATIDSLIGGAAGCVVLVPLGVAVLRGVTTTSGGSRLLY